MSARDAKRSRRAALEKALGHVFQEPAHLEEALTHASAVDRRSPSNERLEFLGDRVLGLLTAEALLARYPGEAEGGLAPRFNALVRKETCAAVAQSIDLGAFLDMAKSEAHTGGRRKTALLADAMEAVIAAVYLDGGLDAARALFERHWSARIEAQEATPIDPKTALQEWAQARALALPTYRTVERAGPDHAPRFTIEAALATGATAQATAGSKRSAEQAAAAALLSQIDAGDAPTRARSQ